MEKADSMVADKEFEPCMIEAISALETYITRTTGQKPSQQEMARALSKFFVLKEIREFIEMDRREQSVK